MRTKTGRTGNSLLTGVIVVAVLVFVVASTFVSLPFLPPSQTLKKFSSAEELNEFLSAAGSGGYYGGALMATSQSALTDTALRSVTEGAPAAQKASADDYSTTNIQVAGVDEADIVKNDGRYIYTLSGNSLSIVEAFPAEEMRLLSTINFSEKSPWELYVNGNRLVVFSNRYDYPAVAEKIAAPSIWPGYGYSSTAVTVYDITDRANPVVERELTFNGTYSNSRMIGDYVYTVLNVPAQRGGPVPLFSPYQRGFPDIYYFDVPDYSYQYTNIVSLNLNDGAVQNKVFLLGYSENMYVSQENLYLVSQKRVPETMMLYKILDEILLPLLPADVQGEIQQIRASEKTETQKARRLTLVLQEWGENNPEAVRVLSGQAELYRDRIEQIQIEVARERDKSVIHKIALAAGIITYTGSGEAPGRPLNQFSMDESGGYFRIATTSEQNQLRAGGSSNNIYVLDGSLKVVGKLEGLAKGERIYSVRFIGERGYMVTFKKVDPLFVIDLSNPTSPQVLGELKIPGYSDYLHPYDENHLIGIGKDTEEAESGNFAWMQGVKLALFDVTDVSAPKELAKTVIGARGTVSEALSDHKAFLFSREKNMLVIPVRVHEKTGAEDSYPEPVFQGAYVYKLTLDGFELRGKITHQTGENYYYGPSVIRRSLYMDEVLYTVSGKMVKANGLGELNEIGTVALPVAEETPIYYTR